MITTSRSLSFTGMRAIHNARTRIFAAGSDPVFSPTARTAARRSAHREFFGDPKTTAPRYWTPGLLDRLQSQLTRYRE